MAEKKKAVKTAKTAPKKTATKTAPKAAKIKKAAPLAHTVGRRKKSVARIWLRRGSGNIIVNGESYKNYFDTEFTQETAAKPFAVCPVGSSYDVQVTVAGGGKRGQADAIKLGIARALVALDETQRKLMREHDLLTVDARVKERKKYGQRGARRKFQFVKR